jgi:hypothetical protein
LVYFEQFDFVEYAIAREKQIKGYSRAKKNALINSLNKGEDVRAFPPKKGKLSLVALARDLYIFIMILLLIAYTQI